VEKKPVILFIDSDREAIEISKMVLENAFDIMVAETGEIGLNMAFEHLPSVVLVDSYLPAWTATGYAGSCAARRRQKIFQWRFSPPVRRRRDSEVFCLRRRRFHRKAVFGKELVEKIWRLLMKKKELQNYNRQ